MKLLQKLYPNEFKEVLLYLIETSHINFYMNLLRKLYRYIFRVKSYKYLVILLRNTRRMACECRNFGDIYMSTYMFDFNKYKTYLYYKDSYMYKIVFHCICHSTLIKLEL